MQRKVVIKLKKKRKKIINALLSIILCVAMIIPSMIAFADGGGPATGDVGDGDRIPVNSPHIAMEGTNVLVGLMAVENTTDPYRTQIDAHNASGSGNTWSELQVALVDNYLKDYPLDFLDERVLSEQAVVRLNRSSTRPMSYVNTSGTPSRKRFKYIYSAKGKTAPTDFTGLNVIGSAIKSNSMYYQAFISHNLDINVVKGLAAANQSSLDTWRDRFVALWADTEHVDDVLNAMFDSNPDSYYDNLLKYLDLLIVINYMCNNARWNLIEHFLESLNQDGSGEFITIAAVSCVYSELPNGDDAIIPMPVYYSMVTRSSLYGYTHFERDGDSGSPVVPNSPGISYETNPTAYVADLSQKYNSVDTTVASGYSYLWGNNRDLIWWDNVSGVNGYGLATALRPTDLNGYSTGNCSYTFLAYREIVATTKSVAAPPSTTTTLKKYPMGQFSIDVTSDQCEVPYPCGTVSAMISIDLKQTAEQRQTIRQAYSAQIASGGGDTASLKIEYGFKCLEGTGDSGTFLDEPIFPVGMVASGNTVIIPGFTWKKFATMTDGYKKVQWMDKDINISEQTVNRYYAKVTLVFNDGTTVKFTPQGKFISDRDPDWEAYDDQPWYVPSDPTKPSGYYYSQIPGNYAEIKEADNPHYNEAFEAMAGVPTNRDLYVGMGATEFMTNYECEKGTDTNKERYYNFDKTFTKCACNDEDCVYSCPGHTQTYSCGATYTPSGGTSTTCPGAEVKWTHQANTQSLSYACPCGAVKGTFPAPAADYVAGTREHAGHTNYHGEKCKHPSGSHSTGVGCEAEKKTNCCHPHNHVIYGKITQKIDTYNYLNVKAAELWRVNKLMYEQGDDIIDTPISPINLNTGFNYFVNQDGYISGNGRLAFSFVLPDDVRAYFGDTKRTYASDSTVRVLESAVEVAHKEWNGDIKDKKIKTTIVSDFITITTTEGYQNLTYNDNVSKEINITSKYFDESGSSTDDNEQIEGNKITWDNTHEWTDLWLHDSETALAGATSESGGKSYSTYTWSTNDIVRSGYNGKYFPVNGKYKNNNTKISSINPAKQWVSYNGMQLPNSQYRIGGTSFTKDEANFNMTITPLNIRDAIVEQKPLGTKGVYTGNEPVSNGEKNTGHARLEAEKVLNYADPHGLEYSSGTNPYKEELGYTAGKGKINNIVIHNPVSVQNAKLMGGADHPDKYVDQRTDKSVESGGDPQNRDNRTCPGDATCQYKTLHCTDPEAGHECQESDPRCYTKIGGNWLCDQSIFNAHEHTDSCPLTDFSITKSAVDGTTITHKVDPGTYYIEIAGAVGSGENGGLGYAGDIVTGVFTVTEKDTELTIKLGTSASGHTAGSPDGVKGSAYASGGSSSIYMKGALIARAAGGSGYKEVKKKLKNINISLEHNMAFYGSVVIPVVELLSTIDGKGGKTVVNGLTDVTIDGSNSSDGYVKLYRAKDKGTNVDKEIICGVYSNWKLIKTEDNRDDFDPANHDFQAIVTCTYESTCSNCGAMVQVVGNSNESITFPTTCKKTVSVREYESDKCYVCDGAYNVHIHDAACKRTPEVLTYICNNPHHHKPGTSWNPSDPANHDPNSDMCWQACNDDSKHSTSGSVIAGGGSTPKDKAGDYINIDRAFVIEYPATGDFAGNPSMNGILDTTDVRGKGYEKGMNCDQWTRNKFVIFTVDVIDENGKLYMAGTPIDVYDIHNPESNSSYTFYCPLENLEQNNGTVQFVSVASNASISSDFVNENNLSTNKERSKFGYAARHSASLIEYMDVIGYIGSLAINDTGDVRFAELFKKPYADSEPEAGWLIPNVVRKVCESVCNQIVVDPLNVRQDVAASQWWHDIYGSGGSMTDATLYSANGGKHYSNVSMPLTPKDNPIKSLQNQPMRPGYNLLMDIQTVGNYYGENRIIELNSDGSVKSSSFDDEKMEYKMQIVPQYYLLDLSTKKYTKLDAYMGVSGEYEKINDFDWLANQSKYKAFKLYLDWLEESARRNYTRNEQYATGIGVNYFSGIKDPSGKDNLGAARSPAAKPDVIGDAQRLYLNDLDRTFMGGQYTYGALHNASSADDTIDNSYYVIQAQRWHFTMGLPSSVVFVEHGKECTTVNIDAIKKKENACIVCTANFKVAGEVWTLEYDGKSINNTDKDSSGNTGFQIVPNGPVYKAPSTDPVIVVYSNKYTSKDDLRTEGTH